jgi:MFS family permease
MTAVRQTAERRLVAVVAAVVFVDTLFYAAIAPLLPELARELRLSKLSAGLMTASYPLGTLIGSLPGGILAVRAGPKRTVYAGLGLLSGSTLVFGLVHNAAALDLARFVEGVGGACSWAGGLAWIVSEAPPSRRGSLIGGAVGAAIGGALFGPVVGTIASAAGRAATFSGVVVLGLVLIDQTRRLSDVHTASGQRIRHLAGPLRDRRLWLAMWLVAVPGLVSGLLQVLGALRLHRLGLGAVAIGATFLVSAALQAVASPAVGRYSDRRGRLVPMRFGLAATALGLACFTLPAVPGLQAAVIVGTALTESAFWAPSMAMLSDAADAHRLDQGLAAALMNLAWAVGQTLGSGAGGAVAKASGDAVPMGLVAGACLVTLALIRRAPRQGRLP